MKQDDLFGYLFYAVASGRIATFSPIILFGEGCRAALLLMSKNLVSATLVVYNVLLLIDHGEDSCVCFADYKSGLVWLVRW